MTIPRAAWRCMALGVVLGAGCATTAPQDVWLGRERIALQELAPADVAQAVEVTQREDAVIYRAPRLSVTRQVDLRRGGPVYGANLGRVGIGQSGFLFGIRDRRTGDIAHHAAFQSDFVEGTNRFRSVALADGTRPAFRVVKGDPKGCGRECYLTFETLIVDLPDASLRGVPEGGLGMSITLDTGTTIPVSAPAAYVRGYLQAVDAPR